MLESGLPSHQPILTRLRSYPPHPNIFYVARYPSLVEGLQRLGLSSCSLVLFFFSFAAARGRQGVCHPTFDRRMREESIRERSPPQNVRHAAGFASWEGNFGEGAAIQNPFTAPAKILLHMRVLGEDSLLAKDCANTGMAQCGPSQPQRNKSLQAGEERCPPPRPGICLSDKRRTKHDRESTWLVIGGSRHTRFNIFFRCRGGEGSAKSVEYAVFSTVVLMRVPCQTCLSS